MPVIRFLSRKHTQCIGSLQLSMGRLYLRLTVEIFCRTAWSQVEKICDGGWFINLWNPFQVDTEVNRTFRITLFGNGQRLITHSSDGELEV